MAKVPPVARSRSTGGTRLCVVPDGIATRPRVAEFFAGIGLVRLGLEAAGFDVVWSNDIEPSKQAMYLHHFGPDTDKHRFVLGDVHQVRGSDLPARLDLAWASFPCTDLSLAGSRAGLAGPSSGTFWGFVEAIAQLPAKTRPATIAVENVSGLATSHGGDDLCAAVRALNDLGYSVDVITLDARRFVPQSRPRLFLIGARYPPKHVPDNGSELRPEWLQAVFQDPTLRTHQAALDPPPPLFTSGLSELVEKLPSQDSRWWDEAKAAAFFGSLSAIQAQRVAKFSAGETQVHRTAYRRTRNGVAVWEVRPDDISGCLRTARGGSSRQAVVKMGNGQRQVRWMTPVEYARLMGATGYRLDGIRINQALFGFGDAVCVPAVSWLAAQYLLPLIVGQRGDRLVLATVPHRADTLRSSRGTDVRAANVQSR